MAAVATVFSEEKLLTGLQVIGATSIVTAYSLSDEHHFKKQSMLFGGRLAMLTTSFLKTIDQHENTAAMIWTILMFLHVANDGKNVMHRLAKRHPFIARVRNQIGVTAGSVNLLASRFF